jgi:PAS domain S-box-containing protein
MPETMQSEELRLQQIENVLRSSEERFRRVVEAAPSAMVMINTHGRIEMVNTQAERVFGYTRAEMLGQPVEMLVPGRFAGNHPPLREAFYAHPESRPMGAGRDLYALRKDGTEFPVEIGLNPIEMADGKMVLSAIVDISDRKQKEQRIEAALKEKDVLLREVHHRVKNNLQIIDSLLNLQMMRLDDPSVADMLRESQHRIRSMALIHQTLYQSEDFARVDFSRFIDSLAQTLTSSYGLDAGRIQVAVEAEPVALPINTAIPCGLAVNELLSNALKHAFPGQSQGRIVVGLAQDGDDTITSWVADNGIGLPEAIDIDTTPTLGLQLVTLLADQVGGHLTLQRSNPTRFTLTLPHSK